MEHRAWAEWMSSAMRDYQLLSGCLRWIARQETEMKRPVLMGKSTVFIKKSSCMQMQLTDLNNVSKNWTSKHIGNYIAFKSFKWESFMCDIIKFHPS